jgi:hypothetical protein
VQKEGRRSAEEEKLGNDAEEIKEIATDVTDDVERRG